MLQQAGGSRWWEVPGGTLREGEHPVGAVTRETFEETGLHLENTDLLRAWSYVNGRGERIACFAYAARTTQTDVRLSEEHSDHAWLSVATYAERYCTSTAALQPWARDFVAQMRVNCEQMIEWIEARGRG